jgi:hypothetical protein
MVMNKEIPDVDKAVKHQDKVLEMPQTNDLCGLTGYFANSSTTLPFDIKRVYFTYNIPDFAKRGGHAHIYTREIVFPIKGQFDVIVEQNNSRKNIHLNTENQGLILDTGHWRKLENFTSETYYEADYIREYRDFKKKNK